MSAGDLKVGDILPMARQCSSTYEGLPGHKFFCQLAPGHDGAHQDRGGGWGPQWFAERWPDAK